MVFKLFVFSFRFGLGMLRDFQGFRVDIDFPEVSQWGGHLTCLALRDSWFDWELSRCRFRELDLSQVLEVKGLPLMMLKKDGGGA